jgi:hypothetical protein
MTAPAGGAIAPPESADTGARGALEHIRGVLTSLLTG